MVLLHVDIVHLTSAGHFESKTCLIKVLKCPQILQAAINMNVML